MQATEPSLSEAQAEHSAAGCYAGSAGSKKNSMHMKYSMFHVKPQVSRKGHP